VTVGRAITLFLLLVATTWAAIVNGQPFFMADTSAYVRAPDFAVVYALGPRFASAWTQQRTLQAENQRPDSSGEQTSSTVPLNAPFDKAVLGGRSIYYGAMLYLGHISSYFWASILFQAAIFVYLSHAFLVKCFRMSFASFVLVSAATLILTPISFYVSFLMPDVFASFLILSTVMLVVFWDDLIFQDRMILSLVALYSVLGHSSHLALLAIMTGLFVVLALIRFSINRKATVVLLVIAFAGLVGELAFSFATGLVLKAEPTRPPFIMARLIDDGPGYRFLKANCATKPYVVCKYLDRLPAKSDAFLWSEDPAEGVYNIADAATRKSLTAEQFSFAKDVFQLDPTGVIAALTKNTVQQLTMIGVDEFSGIQAGLGSYDRNLPRHYADGLSHSGIASQTQLSGPLALWFSVFYFVGLIVLSLVVVLWPLAGVRQRLGFLPQPQTIQAFAITTIMIVLNAAICGALSGPHQRYQTRISWIPVFILLFLAVKLWENSRTIAKNVELARPA
jgi:hypothetical protein